MNTFCRLDELGLEVTGQRLATDRAVLACRVVEPDQWCRRCGCEGTPRDTVTRRLAHELLGWRPTIVHVTIRRCRCIDCGHVWRQDRPEPQDRVDYVLHNGQGLKVLDPRTIVSGTPRAWPDVAGNDCPSDLAAVLTTFALHRTE